MKNFLQKILEKKLRFFARAILRKYRPDVVGITGSVGKTSTKEAVAAVLEPTFRVRKNIKNYNNEIGVPLSIIGSETGGHSLFKWFLVFLKAGFLLLWRDPSYPNVLVLEMGADHPGDLKYLTAFVPLKVAVVTSVGPAHLEFFENVDNVAREKSELVRALPRTGIAILNVDDPNVAAMAKKTKGQVIFYGLHEHSNIRGTEIKISHEVEYTAISTIQGVSFKASHAGSTVPVLLNNVIGSHMVTAALAALAVGLSFNLNLVEIASRLKNFTPPLGRMRLLKGIKHTLLIDDTYNSSPPAAVAALRQLGSLQLHANGRKHAVLGDMLEPGRYTIEGHREVGQEVAKQGIDELITVGEMSRDTIRGAVEAGMTESACFNFETSQAAGKFLQNRIKEGDVLLVKGSQGVRMERIVKELMAEPQRAKELLVRQSKPWV